MKRSDFVLVGLIVGLFVLSPFALAQHQHGGWRRGIPDEDGIEYVLVQGAAVSFTVMAQIPIK